MESDFDSVDHSHDGLDPIGRNVEESQTLYKCYDALRAQFEGTLKRPIKDIFSVSLPTELEHIDKSLSKIEVGLKGKPPFYIEHDLHKFLVLGARIYRMRLVETQEQLSARVVSPEILAGILSTTNTLDSLMAQSWFQKADEYYMPSPAEFLTLEELERLNPIAVQPFKTEIDEKFGILQASSRFRSYIDYARMQSKLRDTSVGVIYVDLDRFKTLNDHLGETEVDRLVLPAIMRSVATTVYSHGFGFKLGGDEYGIVLPNVGRELLLAFLTQLKKNVNAVEVPKIRYTPTFSAGFCLVADDSYYTDLEVQNWANKAMKVAKTQRNCAAGQFGPAFDESKIEIYG